MHGRNNRSTMRVLRNITDATILQFLSSLNTPRSLAVWLLYSSGEHDQLVELSCDPLNYNTADSFRDDYMATSLLSKADFLRCSFDRKAKAIEKFLIAEKQCKETNDRVRPFAPSGYYPSSALHRLIPAVRRKIRSILGHFDLEELLDRSDWGPGVSTLLKGPQSVKPNKYQSETGMTLEVRNVVWPLLHLAYPSWHAEILAKANPCVERGNVVITVPKNSKTDRVIAVEPGWNLWFQKGLGAMMRARLLRKGCNLNDQRINQRLSSMAYRHQLATVDFRSASDTISREVVRLLLPDEWYRILDLFRCKVGRLSDSTACIWEKFSSMGNGFTFELESLIFYAIALVISEDLNLGTDFVSVYGDDVILRSSAFSDFRDLCSLLGFEINQDKSFSSGLFYESCGAHWFRGVDVKPFYLDQKVDTVSKHYNVHNNIMDFAHRATCSAGLDSRFKAVTKLIRANVPPAWFNLVPRDFGDCGFWSNLDQAMTLRTTSVKRMIGTKIRVRAEVPVKLHFDGYGLVLNRVRGALTHSDEAVVHLSAKRNFSRSALVNWLNNQHFMQSGGYSDTKLSVDLLRGNNVSLKTLTKAVPLYSVVGFGRWYNFGNWL